MKRLASLAALLALTTGCSHLAPVQVRLAAARPAHVADATRLTISAATHVNVPIKPIGGTDTETLVGTRAGAPFKLELSHTWKPWMGAGFYRQQLDGQALAPEAGQALATELGQATLAQGVDASVIALAISQLQDAAAN